MKMYLNNKRVNEGNWHAVEWHGDFCACAWKSQRQNLKRFNANYTCSSISDRLSDDLTESIMKILTSTTHWVL